MKFIVLVIIMLNSANSHAGDSTETLPKGIFGVRLNNVFVLGGDYEYGPNGNLGTIGDLHAQSISGQAANTFNTAVANSSVGSLIFNQVINALKNSPAGQYGLTLADNAIQSLDLGQMKMNVVPTIQVTAPTLMYGLTNFWSVIMNVPVVKMRNDVSWEYVPGAQTGALNSASALANSVGITSIPNSSQFTSLAQSALAAKGYQPLQSQEKTFIGDVLLMNVFNLGKAGNFSFGTMNTLSLPTGPAHDSTDLLDAGSFHHTFLEQELTMVYKLTPRFKTYASTGIRYNLPEKTDFRVPVDAQDLDPDASQTENLTRQIGLGEWVETGVKYRLLTRLGCSGGLVYKTKQADSFSGDRGLRYDLLAATYPYTAETATSIKFGLTYDPLSNYQMGSIPFMVDLTYEEVISGVNTPALKMINLAFSTFF